MQILGLPHTNNVGSWVYRMLEGIRSDKWSKQQGQGCPGSFFHVSVPVLVHAVLLQWGGSVPDKLHPPAHLLALLEGLVESVTEGEVGLGLGALDEALDLPGTGASLLLLLAVTGLAKTGLL